MRAFAAAHQAPGSMDDPPSTQAQTSPQAAAPAATASGALARGGAPLRATTRQPSPTAARSCASTASALVAPR